MVDGEVERLASLGVVFSRPRPLDLIPLAEVGGSLT